MGMTSRDSPRNTTFSPNLHFANNGFIFGGIDTANAAMPSKKPSTPNSTIKSSDVSKPRLYLYHRSTKSRVETQIPINMILSPLPPGVKKLRLPPHTVAKPKFFAKSDNDRSTDTLELYTSLVCSSAMQDIRKYERALARARGEELGPTSRPSPASSNDSHSSKDDEEKPLNGGEVKICAGCIARERKRNSRKKTKKPEEEEMFQKDEEKRVIVFNTNEIKDWHEPALDDEETKGAQPGYPQVTNFPPGSMQVDLPMRIACYCRHQNEKLGFVVIFTVKDNKDNVIAQASTHSIMITDDHKTNNLPPQFPPPTSGLPPASHYPGAGVFPASAIDRPGLPQIGHRPFKTSLSTTDLSGLQHNFDSPYPVNPSSNPFVTPSSISTNTSATLTPKTLSRPASPTCGPGPINKRRKHSSSGKIPSNLAMTRLETSHATSNMPASAISSPYTPQAPSYPSDLGYVMPASRNGPIRTSPPTPNSNDYGFVTAVNRSFSMENLPRHAMMSAPSSRQASRPSTPVSNRNSFNQADPVAASAINLHNFTQTRRPAPLIHKIVPAEGSVTGGQEVTLLGNGFYQGLEVMFGDVEATTTTFWGDKTLMCLTPPAQQSGPVVVTLKQENSLYPHPSRHNQSRQAIFTYVDDNELNLYKLAMRAIGRSMANPTDDPLSAAQQFLGQSSSAWSLQGTNYGAGIQHQTNICRVVDMVKLETDMLRFLAILDNISESYQTLDLSLSNGQTLLHLASFLGLTRFVMGLLLRSANFDSLDRNGNTPMHLAALKGHHHIINRLRLAGADNKIRSLRNFVPTDLASSLLARQAAVMPRHHYRARSAGGTPLGLQSRMNSFTSFRSPLASKATSGPRQIASEPPEDEGSRGDFSKSQHANGARISSRNPSPEADVRRIPSIGARSRRSSNHELVPASVSTRTDPIQDATELGSPAAQMLAWRDHIIAQIQQYQHSTQHLILNLPSLPNLPNLPNLPAIPDYQTHPMVRRVSSLFPQRAASQSTTPHSNKEGWWESLTGSQQTSGAPPAYEDLFPNRNTDEDFSLKKQSAMRAAADAAIDRHFETSSTFSFPEIVESDSKIRAQPINSQGRELHQPENSRKLFLIWVSSSVYILMEKLEANLVQMAVVIFLLAWMLKNDVPDFPIPISKGFQYLVSHVREANRFVEVA